LSFLGHFLGKLILSIPDRDLQAELVRQSGQSEHYSLLRLKQSLAGGQSTEPVSATRLAPVSLQGFAPQILAAQFIHFIRELI
jgi:hypothetical protein